MSGGGGETALGECPVIAKGDTDARGAPQVFVCVRRGARKGQVKGGGCGQGKREQVRRELGGEK